MHKKANEEPDIIAKDGATEETQDWSNINHQQKYQQHLT